MAFNVALLFLMNMGVTQLQLLKEDLNEIFSHLQIKKNGHVESIESDQCEYFHA